MYRAWDPAITTPESTIVNELLLHAHTTKAAQELTETLLPSSTTSSTTDSGRETVDETACDLEAELLRIGDENAAEIRELCLPLEIDSRCNLCAIISICVRKDPDQKWLLDYSFLCYKCTAAPRTAMSTLIVATEFLHLLQTHFKDITFDNIFRERIVTIFDFHAHFFINRCFAQRDEHPIVVENITLTHLAVTKALLSEEDTVPYAKKRRIQYKLPTKTTNGKKKIIRRQTEEDGLQCLQKYRRPTGNTTFMQTLFYMWAGTNVMFNTTLTNLAIKKTKTLKTLRTRHSEIEPSIGPIYLSPIPAFRMRNGTTTVCLLCELMACSNRDNVFLKRLNDRITNYSHNNLKIIDRTQLALAEILSTFVAPDLPQQLKNKDVSDYIKKNAETLTTETDSSTESRFELSVATYLILRQVGVTGVYKHFYSDPLCAANIRATNPDILFFDFHNEYLNEAKLAICSTNAYPSPVERDFWLYAHMFKAFQIIKRNFKTKTQVADFLSDFIQVLETHHFDLIDPSFIVDKYV